VSRKFFIFMIQYYFCVWSMKFVWIRWFKNVVSTSQ
jgi:hypothetical protein